MDCILYWIFHFIICHFLFSIFYFLLYIFLFLLNFDFYIHFDSFIHSNSYLLLLFFFLSLRIFQFIIIQRQVIVLKSWMMLDGLGIIYIDKQKVLHKIHWIIKQQKMMIMNKIKRKRESLLLAINLQFNH